MAMRRLFAVMIVWTVLAQPAAAEPLDRLLSAPGAAPLPQGAALIYRHRRAAGLDGGEAWERTISLQRHPDKAIVTATLEGGGAGQTAEFRGTTGNPIVLVFLDAVVSHVSEATGANPFYLRRRIKEAGNEQVRVPPSAASHGIREIAVRPFAGTEHTEALGTFAGLELTFRLSDAVPGRIVSLRATAGDGTHGFTEEMLLDGTT